MKTITKTFYCTYEFYKELQANDVEKLNTIKGDCWTIPIQISWQEPEKKIEITESEFDKAIKEIECQSKAECYMLKKKLFGAEK